MPPMPVGDALAVAERNVELHHVRRSIACTCTMQTCSRAANDRYRVIISNPPYVPES